MNPFIEQLYNSRYEEEDIGVDEVLSDLYDELEKVAHSEGLDLEEDFTDDEVADLMRAHIEDAGGLEKVASALGYEVNEYDDEYYDDEYYDDEYYEEDGDLEKVASVFGQQVAHSIKQELGMSPRVSPFDMEKVAEYDLDEYEIGEYMEKLAHQRASVLLDMAHDKIEKYAGFVDSLHPEQVEDIQAQDQVEELITERAMEILEENGYDPDSILDALS